MLKQYVGVKVVNAQPMTRKEYNAFRGWQVPENENPSDEGYLVEYVDSTVQAELEGKANGYVSWSPKAVFENAYNTVAEDGMTFYAKQREGNIFIGEGSSIAEAKAAAGQIERTAISEDEFDFGSALHLVKCEQNVGRKSWNGCFIFLMKGGIIEPVIHALDSERNIGAAPIKDAIYFFTSDRQLVPYVPTQEDLLADDWVFMQ